MSIYAASLKSYSSASSSTGYSHVSSWGTIATPPPSTPHSAPLTLPTCCPTPPYASGPQAHPVLQQGYNLLLPPRDASTRALYATEPATYPATRSLTLRILVNPTTPFPNGSDSLDIPLSSQTNTPLSVLDVLSTLARLLQKPISRTELGTLSQEKWDRVNQMFASRTGDAAAAAAGGSSSSYAYAYGNGVCLVDWIGGASVVRSVVPCYGERGVWEVRLESIGGRR